MAVGEMAVQLQEFMADAQALNRGYTVGYNLQYSTVLGPNRRLTLECWERIREEADWDRNAETKEDSGENEPASQRGISAPRKHILSSYVHTRKILTQESPGGKGDHVSQRAEKII